MNALITSAMFFVALLIPAEAADHLMKTFTCPQPDGQFANPIDCQSFYVCSFGRWRLETCPSGLSYNPTISACDWATNVRCKTTPDRTGQSGEDRAVQEQFRCPQPSGLFASPSDCSKFYLCSFNQATLMNCPKSLYYNAAIGVCDWDFNVECHV